MKRIIPLIILSLFLSGCAAFAQFRNPIDITTLAQIESGYAITLSAAVSYRDACNKKIIARTTCAPVVLKLQSADRKVQISLRQAREFIRGNPTLDARSLIEAVKRSVDAFKQVALANGVN